MLARSRLVAAGVIGLVAATSGVARAHHSASQGGPLYTVRYLACGERPFERVRCVGLLARDWILSSLGDDDDAVVMAAYYRLREAIPRLRQILATRVLAADRASHAGIEKYGRRGQAAYALAHLGDRASVPRIRELLRELERHGHGSLWEDTLDALGVLDPAAAAAYATEFLGRAKDWEMSLPGGSSKTVALDFLTRANHRAALPVLRRLTGHGGKDAELDHHTWCMMMGARVALGDEPLHTEIRTKLVGHYSGTWQAGCGEELITALGNHPDDAAALVRHLGRLRSPDAPHSGMDYGVTNRSYLGVLRLVWRLRAPSGRDSRKALVEHAKDSLRDGVDGLERRWPRPVGAAEKRAAARLLRDGLRKRRNWPHVSQPGHEDYGGHFAAMHMAALAGLGDRTALARVRRMIDDDEDRSGAAWIAAYWAVRLRLPGAQDRVAALMRRGLGYTNTERTGLYQGIRTRVLDAYAGEYPADARWAVMLLDPGETGERALYLLSRRRPARVCAVVTRAAAVAAPSGVEWAFLALTARGQECRDELAQLAQDATLPAEVRGPAIEMLAAMNAGVTDELIRRSSRDGSMRVYRQRAREILAAARRR